MRQLLATMIVCGLALAGLSRAAAPESPPEPIATRQNLFSIPFRIEPTRSAATAPVEAQLFVSTDRGESWKLTARAEPRQGRFQYRAPQDGEYWFAIRTLDRSQRLRPDKPLSPEMQVLVDTVAPLVEVSAERGSAGEVRVAWKMADPHLDPASLKLDFRGEADIDWQPVAIDADRTLEGRNSGTGETTIWPSDPGSSVVVRAQVLDRAGNPAVSQSEARSRSAGAEPPPAAPSAQGPSSSSADEWSPTGAKAAEWSPATGANANRGPTIPLAAAPGGRQADIRNWPADRTLNVPLGRHASERIATPERERTGPGAGARVAEDLPPPRPRRPAPPRTLALPAAQRERLGPPVEQVLPDADDQEPFEGPEHIAGVPEELGVPAQEAAFPQVTDQAPEGAVQQVNSRRFELDYDIESAGPAGVSRVELWETRDGGQTWRSLATDDDNRSPMLVEVEGEGLYGFTFVIASDTGLSGRPPVAGDPAEVVVAVDLSAPEVKLISAELGAGREAGELKFFWKAEDRLLAERPISLLFSESPEGPWHVISSGLENAGQFVWRIDNRAPDQLFLRVEARDAAGNVGSDQSSEPVQLATVRPSARIRHVRPVPSASRAKIYQFFR
ncbi:MAG: hypothetical protein U0836_05635 [Pirellulales bacterium]